MRVRLFLTALFLAALPTAVFADTTSTKPEFARTATVTTWSSSLTKTSEFTAFEAGFMNGGSIATGDVTGDGNVDIIVGAGPGRAPEVRIFSLDGTQEGSFKAYPDSFTGGVRVAVGDVDGDGKAEIVTAPGPGMEPQINVFRADGSQVIAGGTLAYAKTFTGGVHVAVGDLDGDGKAEIVTTPGPGGGPHVRVWSGTMQPIRDFFAYDADMTDGVTVTIMKTKWGSAIITGVESWSAPLIRRFSADGSLLKEFYAYTTSTRSGVNVTAWDMDGDGIDEIVATPNGSAFADLRVYDLYGTEYKRLNAMDSAYRGGLSVAALPGALVTMPILPVIQGPTDRDKFIGVDLIQQRLYAYEHGRLARTFLISSGIPRHPTPVMEVAVTEKIPVKRYKWYYGPGNPDNYDLPNVKWNLRILGPFHIHYAYWHHNFGHRMSHGCINVGKEDAQWIYDWAEVGTHVSIYDGTPIEQAAGQHISLKGVTP